MTRSVYLALRSWWSQGKCLPRAPAVVFAIRVRLTSEHRLLAASGIAVGVCDPSRGSSIAPNLGRGYSTDVGLEDAEL